MKTKMLAFLSRVFAATMVGRVEWEMDVRYNGFVAFMEGARVLIEYRGEDEFYVEVRIPAARLRLSASSRIVAPRRLGLLWWAAWRSVEARRRDCLCALPDRRIEVFEKGEFRDHSVGDQKCAACYDGRPDICKCGGLVHTEFGLEDEENEGDFWVTACCDKCGAVEWYIED